VRQILLAGEESHKRPALLRDVVTNRALQHRIASLQRVQDRPLGYLTFNIELHLAADLRQRSQMRREDYSDDASTHGNV